MLYGHGDDGYRYGQDIVADFSTNVWFGGEPAGLKEHLFAQWSSVNQYPEVMAESLCQKISSHHNLQASSILVANGSTESIYLIAQAFKASETTLLVPTFAEYEDACRMHGHRIGFLGWDTLSSSLKFSSRLVFICHPNNPTGQVFEDLQIIIENNPETVFVIDEAFIEFTIACTSLIGLVSDHTNVIILRSLTKAFAIPGLRLGYIAAHANLTGKLASFKMPWSVNALALEAGNFIFSNRFVTPVPLLRLLQHKEDFVQKLQPASIRTYPSHTHFFLAETTNGTAKELKQYLIGHHGILIRDASNFRGLKAGHFRLATLSPSKNHLLIEALQTWKKQRC